MTVTPFGVFGAYASAVVTSAIGFGDGSAEFQIHMTAQLGSATLIDNAFMFIAAASPLP